MSEIISDKNSYCVPIPATLAKNLKSQFKTHSASAASFIQQIHYWTRKGAGETVDGVRWIYNTYKAWLSQLQWLSDHSFRKIRNLLMEANIISVKQLGLRDQGRDRTCWYSLNYEHELIKNDPWFSDVCSSTNGTDDMPPTPSVDCSTDITNTTSENSPEKIYIESEAEKKEAVCSQTEQQSGNSDRIGTNQQSVPVKPLIKPPVPRPKIKSSDCNNSSATKKIEDWEIEVGKPYPYFLQWRALHFKQQGGSWANTPESNAYSEFYKNRVRTNVTWHEFLQFYNLTLDNAIALEKAGIEVKLPSCFSDRTAVSKESIIQKAHTLEVFGRNPSLQNTSISAQEESCKPIAPEDEIKPDPDFRKKLASLLRQKTLPKPNLG